MNQTLEPHRRHLWGLAYRMTADPHEADDIVQDTFVRVIEHPPADLDRAIRPWLTRVAMNLARDRLRKRRRAPYFGSWLPHPIDTEGDRIEVLAVDGAASAEARYSSLESASLAFLLAMEALTPNQRAVLLLRDVYEFAVAETAQLLDVTPANVKVTLHRARRRLADYDAERIEITPQMLARTASRLQELMMMVAQRDQAGIDALLSDETVGWGDGGGAMPAAPRPHRGRLRVARSLASAKPPPEWPTIFEVRSINGQPAMMIEFARPARDFSQRLVYQVALDDEGLVRLTMVVTNPAKLKGLSHIWTG